MLSSFLRRLIFAREFHMMDGKIELLGINAVLLPKEALYLMNNKKTYEICKKSMIEHMNQFLKKHPQEHDMMQMAKGIYESLGLGLIDTKTNCVQNIPKGCEYICAGVLAGLMTIVEKKDKNFDAKKLENAKIR